MASFGDETKSRFRGDGLEDVGTKAAVEVISGVLCVEDITVENLVIVVEMVVVVVERSLMLG